MKKPSHHRRLPDDIESIAIRVRCSCGWQSRGLTRLNERQSIFNNHVALHAKQDRQKLRDARRLDKEGVNP